MHFGRLLRDLEYPPIRLSISEKHPNAITVTVSG